MGFSAKKVQYFWKWDFVSIFVEILWKKNNISKSSLKSQIRNLHWNLRFLSDLAESTSTSVRSSWYLWFVLTPSRNCVRDVWKFPNIFIEIEIFIAQIRNLRFLPDLAESTNTSARSSRYLWIVPIPSRNCDRAVWKFPDVLICCSIIIIRKLKIHITKIWVDNFYWDVVSVCDTAGTSSCSVFIETLGLDFFIKADNDFEI